MAAHLEETISLLDTFLRSARSAPAAALPDPAPVSAAANGSAPPAAQRFIERFVTANSGLTAAARTFLTQLALSSPGPWSAGEVAAVVQHDRQIAVQTRGGVRFYYID